MQGNANVNPHNLVRCIALLAMDKTPVSHEGCLLGFDGMHPRHLGDLYEHLLCCVPNVVDGKVQLRLVNHNKQKDKENNKQRQQGAYYTPPEVIHLMVNRLVKELHNEARRRLQLKHVSENGRKSGPSDEKLNMRICDPAMGTGHFLCHFLVEYSLAVMDANMDDGHGGLGSFVNILLEEAQDGLFQVCETILLNCIYGLEKSPTAVQLAGPTLWLTVCRNEKQYHEAAKISISANVRQGDSLKGYSDLQMIEKCIKHDTLRQDYQRWLEDYKAWTESQTQKWRHARSRSRSLDLLISQTSQTLHRICRSAGL